MIISASRRTDIPAFYTPWFINRINEHFLLTRNPFNANQIKRIELNPTDVSVIVFWTKNASKLMPFLPELDSKQYKYYFQYTITGYPRTLESSVPKTLAAIQTFSELSKLIGKDKVVWRYDPILLSNQVNVTEHKRVFKKIAEMLAGRTNRVVISFADFYKKTERNLNKIENLQYSNILNERDTLLELSQYMADIATFHGMQISSCAEQIDTSEAGIPHGKCIDERLIEEVFDLHLDGAKDKGQRDECGCIKSVDIGAYNTCLHECAYCYATYNKNSVINNKKKHNINSPFLIGGPEGVDPSLPVPGALQESLF